MWTKAALISAALVLMLPAFADNPSNQKSTVAHHKTKPKEVFEQNDFQFGQNQKKPTKGNGTGAGKVALGELKDPCKQPKPPQNCKRSK
jgi:hypothetical protein